MNFIETLLIKHNIPYKSVGSDFKVKCLNPEHEDTNPSLNIDRSSGMFNCLSCGYGGQLNKLLEILGESKPSNTTFLALKAGRLREMLQELQQTELLLPEDRKLITLEVFNNIPNKTLLEHACFTSNQEGYIGRVWTPIAQYGNLKFIVGRSIDLGAQNRIKYKIYPKHAKLDFLFNLEKTNSPTIVLVEGLYDYFKLISLGIKNVCPIFGATSFQQNHLIQLKEFNIMGVISMLDNDDAGNKGSNRIKAICEPRGVDVVRFVPETDPGNFSSLEEIELLAAEQGFKIQENNMVF